MSSTVETREGRYRILPRPQALLSLYLMSLIEEETVDFN